MDDSPISLTEQLSRSANDFWDAVGGYLPNLFAALVLIVVAIIAAKLLQAIVEKALDLIGVNKLAQNKNVKKTLSSAEVNLDFVDLVGRFAFWVVIIIFALAIVDVLGLTAMNDVIKEILGYLPSLLAGVVVLTVTVAGARLLRDVISMSLTRLRVDYAHNISMVAFYVLVVFGSLMAIDQLGFDTTILTANITVIVAGFVLALALAFGLGGKDIAGKMVEDAYKHFKPVVRKK